MNPSVLFNEIKTTIKKKQLELPVIMALQCKPWHTICRELNLSLNYERAFNKNEGRAIYSVVIQSLIREDNEAFEDELETEHDLKVAQGWGR